MKKIIWMVMVVGLVIMGASQGYAVPSINGLLGAGEWDNIGYTYYLSVDDPNEAAITPDTMDILRVVLLQELDGDAGGTETTGSKADDGVYLMIQTYSTLTATPTSLEDPDADPATVPVISMSGDFLGNGLGDGFNLFVRHINSDPFTDPSDADVVTFCIGNNAFCNFAINPLNYKDFDTADGAAPNAFGASPARDRVPDIYEYFFPTGLFGTPVAPFPPSFIGTIRFDNGSEPQDDVVIGTLIPEPGTMLLLGGGLLSVLGFGVGARRRFSA